MKRPVRIAIKRFLLRTQRRKHVRIPAGRLILELPEGNKGTYQGDRTLNVFAHISRIQKLNSWKLLQLRKKHGIREYLVVKKKKGKNVF